MTLHRLAFVLFATCLVVAGCATTGPPPPAGDASAELRRLLADSDEATLQRQPMRAVFRGDYRFLDRHGDSLSDAAVEADRNAAEFDLRRLAAIERDRLAAVDRIAYDAFAWQRRTALREYQPELTKVWLPLKLDHFDGWHMHFPELSSGDGVAPYRDASDYDAGLARIDGFVAYLGRAEARVREGVAAGVTQPRIVVERMIAQFDTFARHDLAASPYYGPIRKLPAAMPAAERERLARAYARAVREHLAPAFSRMRDVLRDEVLPRSRTRVGLSALPGGAAYYRFRAQQETTTALEPEQIHRLGVAEAELIKYEMESIRERVGFRGTLSQFFEHLRTDPRFRPASAQAVGDGYRAIGERVAAAMPKLFAAQPRSRLEIRPTPQYQERTDAAARYTPGAPDGSRPGVFHYNTWDLPSRSTFGMETLYLHEAVPGHHFQISLANENEALPKLLRFDGPTAYFEGWALYAEGLGGELGLFTDPYQRFGHLDDEMLRALRLVVDTGLHTMGWTREQAIDYMLARSSISRTDATAEVERYIAIPGQALAYKIGQITISRLRAKAAAALGPAFDIRRFHAQVLDTGALPLAVLEAKIDEWIAAGGH